LARTSPRDPGWYFPALRVVFSQARGRPDSFPDARPPASTAPGAPRRERIQPVPNFKVIDLSHHNANVNFAQIKAAGVVGVIYKASQGTGYTDPTYAARRIAAKAAGLLWGAYHFGTGGDVAAQVSRFMTSAKPDGDTLMALDFEPNAQTPANTMSLAQAKAFLALIEQKLGRKAVLYGGSLINDVLGTTVDPVLAQHRIWWARYGAQPRVQASWPTYWLWQHTDGHNGPEPHAVPGVGPCDCDTFDGSETELRQQWT
jgi:lysozyme